MRVVVTGATGNVGSQVVRALAHQAKKAAHKAQLLARQRVARVERRAHHLLQRTHCGAEDDVEWAQFRTGAHSSSSKVRRSISTAP